MKNFKERLSGGLLFVDGAMGTQLMAKDVHPGICNDYLNIESPEIIGEIHRSYFEAGSDAVYTNSFGANEIALARHNLGNKLEEINAAAAKIAKKAAESVGGEKYVIGDIGPCGDFLQPLGTLEPDKLRAVFAKQAKALYNAGVDGFVVETFMAIDEAIVAVEGVKSVCKLPVFVSLSYDWGNDDFRTMMGATVEQEVSIFSDLDVDAIGFNCGTLKMEQYLHLTEKFVKLLKGKKVSVLAKPNGGKPELINGKAVYRLAGEEFGDWAAKIHEAGAVIIGGCCGTSPAHIQAMTKKLKV
ncbi:MAG: homocysteine S-methyltransferase family protein [Phycisphaerales bacterium]